MIDIDSRTNRLFGDHGTANQAIDFVLQFDVGGTEEFLREWKEGNAFEEWPEFYEYLRIHESDLDYGLKLKEYNKIRKSLRYN